MAVSQLGDSLRGATRPRKDYEDCGGNKDSRLLAVDLADLCPNDEQACLESGEEKPTASCWCQMILTHVGK